MNQKTANHHFFAMKHFFLSIVACCSFQALLAQDVTYVLFSRDCMTQLEYQYAYPNLKGDEPVWAYSLKPNLQDNFIFMTEGEGHYSPEMPKETGTCLNLDLEDAYVSRINRGTEKLVIVFPRQSGGYWLMPVGSATMVARNGSKYRVNSVQSSFQFDTLKLVNEQNLAVPGSPTSAYYSGTKLNKCLPEYSFHCEPGKQGQLRSDFQFIPGIGIINDRTGNSASQAMENELQLVKVNGKDLAEYVSKMCPEGPVKVVIPKYQKPAAVEEVDQPISSVKRKENAAPDATASIDCADNWEPGTHIVQKGENLRAIARTYNLTEQQLVRWNKIQNPNLIDICQKIWLKPPPADAIVGNPRLNNPPETGKVNNAQGITQDSKENSRVLPVKKPEPGRPTANSDEVTDSEDTGGNTTAPRIHTVSRGEYLYKIAKMYMCPEQCIRIANDMPLEGDETLTIGQELIIPECTCTVGGKVIRKPGVTAAPATNPAVKKPAPAVETKPVPATKKPKTSILDESEVPIIYEKEEKKEPLTPVRTVKPNLADDSTFDDHEDDWNNDQKPAGVDRKKMDPDNMPQFKEHRVQQGETLKSIAVKFRVDVSELSLVNGINPKEALVPGKVILIPIDGGKQ